MATINVYRSQEVPRAQTPNARANPAAVTPRAIGSGSAANAAAAATESLAKITAKIHSSQQESLLSRKALEVESDWQQTEAAIAAEPDPDKHQEIYEGFQQRAAAAGSEFAGDYGRLWQEQLGKIKLRTAGRFNSINRRRRVENAKANYQMAIETAVRNKNAGAAVKAVDKMEELGLLAPAVAGEQSEAARLKDNLRARVQSEEIKTLAQAAPQEAVDALSSGDWRKNFEHISDNERLSLLQDARLQLRRQESRDRRRQAEVYEQSRRELFTALLDEKLTNSTLRDYYDNERIDEKEYLWFSEMLKPSNVKLTDEDVWWDTKIAVWEYQAGGRSFESVMDLLTENRKYMTISDTDKLFNALTKAYDDVNAGKYMDFITASDLQWGEKALKKAYDEGGIFGEGKSREARARSRLRLAQWEEFIKGNPSKAEKKVFEEAMLADVWDGGEGLFNLADGFDILKWQKNNKIIAELISGTYEPPKPEKKTDVNKAQRRRTMVETQGMTFGF